VVASYIIGLVKFSVSSGGSIRSSSVTVRTVWNVFSVGVTMLWKTRTALFLVLWATASLCAQFASADHDSQIQPDSPQDSGTCIRMNLGLANTVESSVFINENFRRMCRAKSNGQVV